VRHERKKVKINRSLATLGASTALVFGAIAGLAPAAQAATDSGSPAAVAKATDRGVTATKAAGESAAGAAVKGDVKSAKGILANCYNGRVSGRNFYMTCSGNGYKVYVDCSDGYRYTFPTVYYGTWNHTLTCPVGTYALWGGSIGG
jgi:hypothetical protein